jgi:hypothetical protein
VIDLVARNVEILGAQTDDIGKRVGPQVQHGDAVRLLEGHERSRAVLLDGNAFVGQWRANGSRRSQQEDTSV